MKLKIYALYTAGLALLVGAASTGNGFNVLPASAWGGELLAAIIMAALGVICLGYGRGLEIEQQSRKRRQRIERPEYRKNRRDA